MSKERVAGGFVDTQALENSTRGRWRSILCDFYGVNAHFLDGVHRPCPGCGGRDRFRFDDRDGAGTFICSQGGGEILSGNGVALLMHITGKSWREQAVELSTRVGVELKKGWRPSEKKFERPAKMARIEYDPEKLKKLAGDLSEAADLIWLANRSEIDPAGITANDFLRRLYIPASGERVLVFSEYKSQGQAIWPTEKIPSSGPDGIWFLAQPVDGKMRPNPRLGKMSRRSEESVLAWRWMVLESDEAPLRLWLGALARVVPRIAAITTSGGRSVHALVRVDARSKREWDEIKREVLGLVAAGADQGALSAVRLTRLPGCWRGEKEQKLLYFAPSAPALTIAELLPRRDVLAFWREECRRVAMGGFADREAVARALAGCRHYGRFDEWLTSAAEELEREISTKE